MAKNKSKIKILSVILCVALLFATFLATLPMFKVSTSAHAASKPLSVTWVASEQGFENAKPVSNIFYNGAFTGVFAKTDKENPPTYYNSGSSVRMYYSGNSGNTLTLTASGDNVFTCIKFTYGDTNRGMTADKGTLNNDTWTGNASEIVFTVFSSSGSTLQVRIKSITVYMPATVEDVVDTTSFPTGTEFGWKKGTDYCCYKDADNLYFTDGADFTKTISLTTSVAKDGNAYKFVDTDYTVTFDMTDDVLTTITVTGSVAWAGTYEPHEHILAETHARVEATCLNGHKAYYECACGTYFADEALTEVIGGETALEAWLEGDGCLPGTGHHFSGEITYTWDDETHECTAVWYCDHTGCTESQSETVVGVYAKDTDATCVENEKGHYKAEFSLTDFGVKETEAASYSVPNTKLGHTAGEIEYVWNDETHQCTRKSHCGRCDAVIATKTVDGVYVKDTDATADTNEKGHWEAHFVEATAENSYEVPNSKRTDEDAPQGLSKAKIIAVVVAGCVIIVAGLVLMIAVNSSAKKKEPKTKEPKADKKAKAEAKKKAKAEKKAQAEAEKKEKEQKKAEAKAKAETEKQAKAEAKHKAKSEAKAKQKAAEDKKTKAKAKKQPNKQIKKEAETKKASKTDAKAKAETKQKAAEDKKAKKELMEKRSESKRKVEELKQISEFLKYAKGDNSPEMQEKIKLAKEKLAKLMSEQNRNK